ncbi:MAG: hypothetical protein MI923_22915 [Phycisphaerales bacterium]|nr:hypothetical protein [Phycisphaerales bacterium]
MPKMLFAFFLCVLLSCKSSSDQLPQEEQSDPVAQGTQDAQQFIKVRALDLSRGRGIPWELAIDADGSACLKSGYVQRSETRFKLARERMDDIRQSLRIASFETLADSYGGQVPDGSTRRIIVEYPEKTKEVAIYFLPNVVEERERAGVRRFLKVWSALRNSFQHVLESDPKLDPVDFYVREPPVWASEPVPGKAAP